MSLSVRHSARGSGSSLDYGAVNELHRCARCRICLEAFGKGIARFAVATWLVERPWKGVAELGGEASLGYTGPSSRWSWRCKAVKASSQVQ